MPAHLDPREQIILRSSSISGVNKHAEIQRRGAPCRAVPVGSDVGRYVVSLPGAIHGRVERIERLKHVESLRVGVEQLTNERRTTSLVR